VKFEPKPSNTFNAFIDAYFSRCAARFPKLRGLAGKWTFDDLIPGLSDFDTRLIFSDDVTPCEWAQMSIAVGEIHTQLAGERREWARILEHLPGLNLKTAEMLDPVFYYPEFRQWTYYRGDASVLNRIRGYLEEKPWEVRDELFHLKKFATYYGPYCRGIDPPVNMGPWESKYPLHSRYMHYFTPPVQAAMSIVRRQGVCGKMEALQGARETFPNPDVIDRVLDAVEQHYELEVDYEEPRLTGIERQLDDYLRGVYAFLADYVTLIEVDPSDSPAQLKARVAAIPVDPVERFYEGAKFSRFMKGRLLFYATDIPWFDTTWIIRNEIVRMKKNFYETPLTTYGQVFYADAPPSATVLDRLARKGTLSSETCSAVRQLAVLLDTSYADEDRRERARQIAELFEPAQLMLEILGAELVAHFKADGFDAGPV